jgi:hypothetical protein
MKDILKLEEMIKKNRHKNKSYKRSVMKIMYKKKFFLTRKRIRNKNY